MSDVTLDVVNRRANVAAVHAEAQRIGADADKLLDSVSFYSRATSLDPDAPGYHGQVRDLVASAAGQHQAPAVQPLAQAPAPPGPRQWTMDDVMKSGPAETVAALEAGLLVDLGYAPKKRRR